MAKDGLSIRLEGGLQLDRALAKMAITQQSRASTLAYQALNKGAAVVRKNVKNAAPKGKGELKNSVKSGLRKKSKRRNLFMAAVFFKYTRVKGEDEGTGGWYSIFIARRHKRNAFGNRGGKDFITPAVKQSKSSVRKTIGTQLAKKIADENQKNIDRLK